ncbi:DUF5807 family protein [Halomarina litorea]|uniref:DUF5807 family protein n=1 Tax=Halomarina litorea TaxID=2961595 RepID=UPI0020C4937D|nr:DUF5807 family protein [Halomarina sp. BCD28]
MDTPRREFLDGDRPDDVLIYVAGEDADDVDALAAHGERVDDGVVLVLPGDQGRSVFQRATGMGAMDFAGAAMKTDGEVADDLTGGTCPSAHDDEPDADHRAQFVLAFAEAQNEEVGGIYEEGTVVHAYVSCSCGTAYSDRWVVGDA